VECHKGGATTGLEFSVNVDPATGVGKQSSETSL